MDAIDNDGLEALLEQHEEAIFTAPEVDEHLANLVEDWFAWDKNVTTREVIQRFIDGKEIAALRTALTPRLTFGTAGIRGIMGAGFACLNDLVIIQTTQGLAKYLELTVEDAKKKGIVIGYDGRRNSRRFAELTAAGFVSLGFKTYFYSAMCPTPFVPFAVSHFKCSGGVMVTASHNPKDDNGYKVYWENGAQIISPHDRGIQDLIMQNLEPWPEAWKTGLSRSVNVINPLPEVMAVYYDKLLDETWCDEAINKEYAARFVYTPMHGVGHSYMTEAFKSVGLKPFIPVLKQRDPHPEFPTVRFPNPEEGKSALNLAIESANQYNCNIILANDPDADRLAVAERLPNGDWKIFNGNELGALLGWWCLFSHIEVNGRESLSKCKMLASTVSSKILQSMAEVEGFEFLETLTGFKWMGNKSYDFINQGDTVLFAFEEAIGFMCGTKVLDKDGISAAVRVAELTVHLEMKGLTLMDQLKNVYDMYGYHVSNNSYYVCKSPHAIIGLFTSIRRYTISDEGETHYPTGLLGDKYKVVAVRDLTTGYDSEQPDHKAILPVSRSSQMITFKFDNGMVATLRTSGTEPKIKYYTELRSAPGETDWEAANSTLNEMVQAIVDEWLRPDRWPIKERSNEEEEVVEANDVHIDGSGDASSNHV